MIEILSFYEKKLFFRIVFLPLQCGNAKNSSIYSISTEMVNIDGCTCTKHETLISNDTKNELKQQQYIRQIDIF